MSHARGSVEAFESASLESISMRRGKEKKIAPVKYEFGDVVGVL